MSKHRFFLTLAVILFSCSFNANANITTDLSEGLSAPQAIANALNDGVAVKTIISTLLDEGISVQEVTLALLVEGHALDNIISTFSKLGVNKLDLISSLTEFSNNGNDYKDWVITYRIRGEASGIKDVGYSDRYLKPGR